MEFLDMFQEQEEEEEEQEEEEEKEERWSVDVVRLAERRGVAHRFLHQFYKYCCHWARY